MNIKGKIIKKLLKYIKFIKFNNKKIKNIATPFPYLSTIYIYLLKKLK